MNNNTVIEKYLEKVKTSPQLLEFKEIMDVIDAHYNFTPTAFKNGDIKNSDSENLGSCKIFSFAQLHGLSVDETVACFGAFYREDVLQYPDAENHTNIRSFLNSGWNGIEFSGEALSQKS